MHHEFDTVAEWTAGLARQWGTEFYLPAACRGSGTPSAMRWLVDRLRLAASDRMLDCGAGLGGPAAFARQECGVNPILTDPEAGACRGARALFGLPAVQAAGELPFPSASMDVVWSIGVLCTVGDQPRFLAELRRVLRPEGRLGLLVYVATTDEPGTVPDGNHFPRRAELDELLADSGFSTDNSSCTEDFAAPPPWWTDRLRCIDAGLEMQYRDDARWRKAADQQKLIGELLARGDVVGTLIAGNVR